MSLEQNKTNMGDGINKRIFSRRVEQMMAHKSDKTRSFTELIASYPPDMHR
jgi:Zn-finger domain-containing protein